MSWLRKFEKPIAVNGANLVTLRDAGEYIAALPAKVSSQPHWQTAIRELMLSAERGGNPDAGRDRHAQGDPPWQRARETGPPQERAGLQGGALKETA